MQLRDTNVDKMQQGEFDVLIIGAGINGAVSAASLSRKGVKVALIDKADFASETSSNSSNLAWGGIKYLENHEYFLVNKLCKSRNHLMRSYPSTVKEIRFLTTLQKGFRFPLVCLFRCACLLDYGPFFTRRPIFLKPETIKSLEPAIEVNSSQGGFEYSDAFLHDNDARFVFNFVRTAMDNGACIANYICANGSERTNDKWITQAYDSENDSHFEIRSKVIINACGPYVDEYNQINKQETEHQHAFSKAYI